jgi:tRNA-dihydrouridine synthase C
VQINTGHINPRAWAGRMKQWLSYLRRRHPEAERAYQQLRTVSDSPVMVEWLDTRLAPAGAHACDPACA